MPCTGCDGAHVHRDLEAVRQAGLGQQRLGLVDIELVGVVGAGAQQAHRQEVLVHDTDVLDDGVADGGSRPAT
jgi:hypothetical protein